MKNLSEISFEEIVKQHQIRVFNTAISFLQNKEDAEDVTQEVFIEIYHSLDSFRRQANVSTWIYRITVNRSLDFIRKKNAKKRQGFLTTLFSNDSGEINLDKGHFDHPGILFEKKESARVLFAAINCLKESQKTAFILFHVEELSQKEIALIMDLSPKAVESLILRAKTHLREKLKNFYNNRGI